MSIILKLATLAKEGIAIDIMREALPDKVTFPTEPIYEGDVLISTALSKTDSKIRNEQDENSWFNKCQKMEAAGILCGDRPLKFCDNKALSLTYLSLGTEVRRNFGSQEPTVENGQVSTMDLWDSLNNVLAKQRNIAFELYTFLTQKQLKREVV